MKKNEANKLAMYNAVVALLDANIAKLNPMPAIVQVFNSFKSLVAEIKDIDYEFVIRTRDETMKKKMKRTILCERIFRIANALFVLGARTNDTDLLANAKFTKWELNRMRDTLLSKKCEFVLAKANEHQQELVDYGITQSVIAEAEEALDEFTGALGEQTREYENTAADRLTLTEKFKTATSILKQELDRLMTLIENEAPDFYNAYRSARTIKDLGLQHGENTTD